MSKLDEEAAKFNDKAKRFLSTRYPEPGRQAELRDAMLAWATLEIHRYLERRNGGKVMAFDVKHISASPVPGHVRLIVNVTLETRRPGHEPALRAARAPATPRQNTVRAASPVSSREA